MVAHFVMCDLSSGQLYPAIVAFALEWTPVANSLKESWSADLHKSVFVMLRVVKADRRL